MKRKKRLLLEEIHRQCLEGELEPKKKTKTVQLSAGTLNALKAAASDTKDNQDEAKQPGDASPVLDVSMEI